MPAGAGTTAPADPYSRLAGIYDDVVVDPCYPRWASFCADLWQLDSQPVRDVLDVCCGTGRLMGELGRLGYRTIGVDASEAMVTRARERLGPDAEVYQAWLPDLGAAATVDAAVSTFDGLNYVPADVFSESVAAVAQRLRPGGWFIFDLHTDAMMNFSAAHPTVTGESAGWRYAVTSDVDVQQRSCRTVIEARSDGGESFTETHRQYFHSDATVRQALSDAGFSRAAVYDEYTPEAATPDTLRATWVARR